MKTITAKEFKKLANKGKMFSVQFVKKDGTLRDMVARLHVSATKKPAETRLSSGVRKAEDEKNQVLTVYDMNKVEDGERGQFRRINLKTIKKVKVDGTEYKVEADD